MPSIAEQIAEIARHIGEVRSNLATLRREMRSVDKRSHAYVRLQDLVAVTEIALRRMEAHRAELLRKRGHLRELRRER